MPIRNAGELTFPRVQKPLCSFLTQVKAPELLREGDTLEARAWLADQALWAVRGAACLKNDSHGTPGNKYVVCSEAQERMSLGGQTSLFQSLGHRGSHWPSVHGAVA